MVNERRVENLYAEKVGIV
jgi:hypothetical protein